MRFSTVLSALPGFAVSLMLLSAPTAAQAQASAQGSWAQVAPGQWADPAQQCSYRVERRGQAFPVLRDHASAVRLAGALKDGLAAQGVRDIQVRPAARGTVWGIFASYVYPSKQGDARVAQLYLSQGGLLRTVTASTRAQTVSALPLSVQAASTGTPATCWPDLARWVEFSAN
ncbi:hypothetical protein [Deinococcus piscis]|uniref:hypothetical protein n=1 Tax=Deinococcus piscis TaxID=394230 RepID=UPI0016799EA8|nr:hypothetical protein [Deinococcus piscis]